jgi:hypothetical protein
MISDVRYSSSPAEQFVGFEAGDVQRSVLAQVSAAVFGDGSAPFFYLQAMAAGILILAANTAYNGFPLLGSILAQDRYLPRQLHTRGDRLVYSNGVLLLAVFAALLIVVFEASVTRLIQLYIIGVFTSFTFGQAGMVKHWNRLLRAGLVTAERRPACCAAGRSTSRRGADRRGAGDRHGHQVHPRALPGAHRHAGPLRAHARHPPALRVGRRGAGARGRAGAAAQPQPRRSCWCPRCTRRPCARWPTPAPPGRTT